MKASLPDRPLDIVGDIHGELPALRSLMAHLGYDERGRHPGGRHLVFVGDLCDRGPDSPGVIDLVRRIVEDGSGQAVLGNHELNLLRQQHKEGNDWFWDEVVPRDQKFEPYARVDAARREDLLSFLDRLPLSLERDDLRVVHAAWHPTAMDAIARAPSGSVAELFDQMELEAQAAVESGGWHVRAESEEAEWGHLLHDDSVEVPMLEGLATCDELLQMANPVRVLTSGVERKGDKPFFASGKWRFVERVKWWNEYLDAKPVVVGHYWRRMVPLDRKRFGKAGADLFEGLSPKAWHGLRRNVFCVDFSVGGRFKERLDRQVPGTVTKLAALQWPENTLVLDSGEVMQTHEGS